MKQDHLFGTSSPLVVAGYLLVLYQYGGCLSPCMFCLVWMANVLLSVDGQYWEHWEQLIDVLDVNSSSAGFHPSPVFNSTLLCLFSECRWGQVWLEPLGAYLIGYLSYGLPQRVSTGEGVGLSRYCGNHQANLQSKFLPGYQTNKTIILMAEKQSLQSEILVLLLLLLLLLCSKTICMHSVRKHHRAHSLACELSET